MGGGYPLVEVISWFVNVYMGAREDYIYNIHTKQAIVETVNNYGTPINGINVNGNEIILNTSKPLLTPNGSTSTVYFTTPLVLLPYLEEDAVVRVPIKTSNEEFLSDRAFSIEHTHLTTDSNGTIDNSVISLSNVKVTALGGHNNILAGGSWVLAYKDALYITNLDGSVVYYIIKTLAYTDEYISIQ